jgi:hypothetical protein
MNPKAESAVIRRMSISAVKKFIASRISAALVLPLLAAAHAQGQVTAIWNGGTGNWSVASNWSTGIVPNNGINTYHVVIDGNNPVVSAVTTTSTR